MFDPKNKIYRGHTQDKKDGSNTDLANKNDFTSKLIYGKKLLHSNSTLGVEFIIFPQKFIGEILR